jgi:hypothetical protein
VADLPVPPVGRRAHTLVAAHALLKTPTAGLSTRTTTVDSPWTSPPDNAVELLEAGQGVAAVAVSDAVRRRPRSTAPIR